MAYCTTRLPGAFGVVLGGVSVTLYVYVIT
jgi:hypothetical protein